jgi:hypothetical protein
VVPKPVVPASALKLTGILTFYPSKMAMFVLQEPGKPPVNSKLLREGDADEFILGLRILEIDGAAGVVRVLFQGQELALNFVENRRTAPPPLAPRIDRVVLPARPTRLPLFRP